MMGACDVPVQKILKPDGSVAGYQARWRGKTKYVGAGVGVGVAMEAAHAHLLDMIAADPGGHAWRKIQRNNTSGVNGLRVVVQKGRQCVQASWYRNGRPHGTHISIQAHGPVEATRRAIEARNRATDNDPIVLSPRAAWARISRVGK